MNLVAWQSNEASVWCPPTGMITQDGQIACNCRACCPGEGKRRVASVSCSEFEEHAGSRERRPGESIYVTAISTSLKVGLPHPTAAACRHLWHVYLLCSITLHVIP